jgi:hypothetical protein
MTTIDDILKSFDGNSEELNKPRVIELKVGDEHPKYNFTVNEFMTWYISTVSAESRKWSFSLNFLLTKWLSEINRQRKYCNDVFFRQHPSQTTTKHVLKGIFRKKIEPITEPKRELLLFEDENLKPFDFKLSEDLVAGLAERTKGNIPYGISTLETAAISEAGFVYDTGKRLIFDSLFTDSNIYAYTTHALTGQINLDNFLKCFNKTSIPMPAIFERKALFGMKKVTEDFPVKAFVSDAGGDLVYTERSGFGPGAVIGITTNETEITPVNHYWIGADNSKVNFNTIYYLSFASPALENIKKLKQIDFIDMLGLQLYAAKNNFWKASNIGPSQNLLG